MLAYHSDEKLKQSVLARMAAHREADTLMQGYGYWKDGKGCAVGCLINSNKHAEYETRFGIPIYLARLEDGIFERLPAKEAKEWPERFLDAIPVGGDLSMVFYKFIHWLLVDPQDGVLQYVNTGRTKKNIIKIADIYKQYIDGEISLEDMRDAAAATAAATATATISSAYAASDLVTAAYAAAAAATPDAADAAVAADTAAAAAADAAAAAAYTAAYIAAAGTYTSAYTAAAAAAAAAATHDAAAATWRAKKQAVIIKQADKMIELIKSA